MATNARPMAKVPTTATRPATCDWLVPPRSVLRLWCPSLPTST